MKQILASLHIKDVKDAKAEYAKVVKKDAVINANGNEVKAEGGFDVANDAVTADNLPIYVCEVDGEEKYVIPMTGQGLWGGIWGYMAVNSDGNTIYGVYFSHASETPGLGAEIASEKFTKLFDGKSVFLGDNVIKTVKGRLSNEAVEVNSISGATITCNGVNAMLDKCLNNYKNYLAGKQHKTNVESAPCTAACENAEAKTTEE
jgi:Na+-transporting NADH:ubiquinone oxidoreductase subunit C